MDEKKTPPGKKMLQALDLIGEKTGLSRTDIALKAGFSPSTVTRFKENQERVPSKGVLKKLELEFHINRNWILREEEEPFLESAKWPVEPLSQAALPPGVDAALKQMADTLEDLRARLKTAESERQRDPELTNAFFSLPESTRTRYKRAILSDYGKLLAGISEEAGEG